MRTLKTLILLVVLTSGLRFPGGGALVAQPATNPSGNTAEQTKPCFGCNKSGTTKCSVATCRNGRAECPGPCLKLTKGVWIQRDVPGHTDPTERWQARRVGNKTWYFSSKHVGEYYLFDASGQPVAHGCTVCGAPPRLSARPVLAKERFLARSATGRRSFPRRGPRLTIQS